MIREVQLPDLDSRRLAAAGDIDLICDSFENKWSQGETPRIEEFLAECDPSVREKLFVELLLVDREFRAKRGEIANRQVYRRQFPDYSTVIDKLEFATIDDRKSRQTLASLAPPAVAGGKLAHFELLEELGSGASGTVWKARDTRLERLVAIKMPRQQTLSAAERARFIREGQTCAQLRHPNIVAVYEQGEDEGRAYIVTEFIHGVDLREWLSHRRPTPKEATQLAAQLACALHHAHDLGIIHRDLKPANVLMDSGACPHITDFGLAKWKTDGAGFTVEGNVLGTPAYMSPEQARGDAYQVDRRSDVYGLGALLYEMLTARQLFEGDIPSTLHQVTHNEPLRPAAIDPAIPRDLETICLKAIEKDPSRRYQSAQEMGDDLQRFLRGDPILARRRSWLETAWRSIRRRPAFAASLLLGLVLVLAVAMIASLTHKNYALQGYRRVRITTQPAGARVALVPIDERTGEPNPDPAGIVRPSGTTPLTTYAKPGRYFIEAALPGTGKVPDFTETYCTVPETGLPLSKTERRTARSKLDDDAADLPLIKIKHTEDIVANMVAVPIDEELRANNPLLPKLLYVDPKQTTISDAMNLSLEVSAVSINDEGKAFIRLIGAMSMGASFCKRVPSAADFDAVLNSMHNQKSSDRGSATIDGLYDDVAEWTTTQYSFPGIGTSKSMTFLKSMIVVKGYGRINSPPEFLRAPDGQLLASPTIESAKIGCRFVRSGAPRFVVW